MAISSLDSISASQHDRAVEPIRRAPPESDRGTPIVSEPEHESPVDRRPDVVRSAESAPERDSRLPPREPEPGFSPRAPADLALDVARADKAIDRLREANSHLAVRRSLTTPD